MPIVEFILELLARRNLEGGIFEGKDLTVNYPKTDEFDTKPYVYGESANVTLPDGT